jgi:uracil-DNA glycosylase
LSGPERGETLTSVIVSDESAPGEDADALTELKQLCGALTAHLDLVEASGAWGLPASAPVPARAPKQAATAPEQARLHSPHIAAPASAKVEVAPAVAVSEQGGARLVVLANEVKSCTRCALHSERRQTVFARGTGASGLMFVGEGPGEEEDIQGQPFVGPAGQLLDRMIGAMKLDRDAVYVCNIVKCRPPRNRKPEPDEMQKCMPYLEEQIALLTPKVIVALGATAVQGLLGTSEGITRLRGQWKLFRGKVPVMPTFHPAFLLRQPGAKKEVWADLQEVMRLLQEGA